MPAFPESTRVARSALILGVLLVAGCGVFHRPAPPPDIASVPDAVPEPLPRSRAGNPPFYEVFGERYYVLDSSSGYLERGVASWYGPKFHGKPTSNGETYDMYGMTAAHKTLPIPSFVEVTNLKNGKKAVLRVNDRGPFVDNRLIDLSYAAAYKLDIIDQGTSLVEVRVVDASRSIEQPAAVTLATAAQTAQPETAVRLYAQVGAFGDRKNAERMQQRLEASGVPRLVIVEEATGNQALYRVRVGPIETVEAYDLAVARLRAMGIQETHLVTE